MRPHPMGDGQGHLAQQPFPLHHFRGRGRVLEGSLEQT